MAMLTIVMSSRVMKRPRQSTTRTTQGLLRSRVALTKELTHLFGDQLGPAAAVGVAGGAVPQPRELDPGGVGQHSREAVDGGLEVAGTLASAEEQDLGLDR